MYVQRFLRFCPVSSKFKRPSIHGENSPHAKSTLDLRCPLTFFLSVASMLAVTAPSTIARLVIWVGAEADVRAGSGLEQPAVSRRQRQLSTIVSCRLMATVAEPKLCLYGRRAQPEEELSSERQWGRTRGWSASPGCSSSSNRRRARPRGTLTLRHNLTTKQAAALRLGQLPVHMCTSTRPKFCVALVPQTYF